MGFSQKERWCGSDHCLRLPKRHPHPHQHQHQQPVFTKSSELLTYCSQIQLQPMASSLCARRDELDCPPPGAFSVPLHGTEYSGPCLCDATANDASLRSWKQPHAHTAEKHFVPDIPYSCTCSPALLHSHNEIHPTL